MCDMKEYIKGLVKEVYGVNVDDHQISPFQTQFIQTDNLPVGPFRGDGTKSVDMVYYGRILAIGYQGEPSQQVCDLHFPNDAMDKRNDQEQVTVISMDPTTGHAGLYGDFLFAYAYNIRNVGRIMLMFIGWRIRLSV